MNTGFLLFALHLPERRMFNEFYAKDTSRKIRAVFKAKGQSGKPLSTNPPYGYVKDPEDKTHWLVDEKAAEVIREIFRLCIQGYGVYTSTEGMQYLFPGMDQGFWESNAQTLQESISYLTSEYLNESTQDYSHSPCQWTFHKSSHYLYGAETAASYDSSRDNDEISIWAPIGNGEDGRYRIVTISRRDQKDYKLNNREKKELMRAFVSYLIDESNGNKYQEEISSFIIKKSDDKKITEYLNSVREGVILYTGLNYNIDEIGSLKRDLTLYLDMEVLFDIYGYNGEVFQRLALDLFKLARDANSKEKRVRFRYFEETKAEIDLFFAKAEEIVKGKVLLKDNVAMKAITNGCQDVSDISERKADFYT